VRTRAAVAKEAGVGTTRVGGRGKGGGAGGGRGGKGTRNTKSAAQAKGGGAAAARAKPAGRGRQEPSRSQSSEQEPSQDPCTSEDNVEADLDLGEEKQEEGAEEIREMEEESAGRSAEKVAGAGDDDGSAAPLPERVIGFAHMLLSWSAVAVVAVALWIVRCVMSESVRT
jgi:hypothetical protein